MNTAELDHLVVAAANLEQGEEYIKSKLGVRPVAGGRHVEQGTHNSLLKLGKDQYLEIIAIDPHGTKPRQDRWFNLDNPDLQKSITQEPKLISWVARTKNMEQALSRASYNPGTPKSASRGSLNWAFTFAPNGSLIESGLLPALIEWKAGSHPSASLPDSKIKITKFEAFHPFPDVIRNHLKSLNLHRILKIHKHQTSRTGLCVTFSTPRGVTSLSGLKEV